MVPHPGAVLGGRIEYGGRNVLEFNRAEMRELRAHEIAMIFQDPASALNPVFRIGHQISEVLRLNAGLSRAAARSRSIELLERVGIPAPDRRMSAYPHELSGGMRQRVMIAMALAGEPRLLLADEPTTALDVTIQDQVLRLLEDLRRERNMSMILVSHDMGVIGTTADRVAVMYAGRIVEVAPVDVLFSSPDHPYTRAPHRRDAAAHARGSVRAADDSGPAAGPAGTGFGLPLRPPVPAGSERVLGGVDGVDARLAGAILGLPVREN